MKKLLLILLCLPMIGFGQILSPSVVSSSGASYSNGGVIMDFTLGEIVIETFSNNANILTQGFHQGIIKIVLSVSDIDIKTKMEELYSIILVRRMAIYRCRSFPFERKTKDAMKIFANNSVSSSGGWDYFTS